jgi:hypothetical protein
MSKILDQVRDTIRTRHYSIRTEEAYICWSASTRGEAAAILPSFLLPIDHAESRPAMHRAGIKYLPGA